MNKTPDTDWSEMLALAKSLLNLHSEINKKYQQVMILHTADGEKIKFSFSADSPDELRKKECEEVARTLEKYNNPAVLKMICAWQNGEIDAPAFDVMKTMCRMNEQNRKTSVLLSVGPDAFCVKSIKDIIG